MPAPSAQPATDAPPAAAATRAAALTALKTAPRAQAVPVLQRVLTAGTEADRQLALVALRTLAQQQGDDDGRIRDVLRQATYHSDGEAASNNAQAALDTVEQNLASIAKGTER